MTGREDRLLPNRYVRGFMQATEAETGDYSLRMMLRNAGLDRFINKLPPENDKQVVRAAEFAALQAAIRKYYGNGARGSLNRIGRHHWDSILVEAPVVQKVRLAAARRLPILRGGRSVLNYLASKMSAPNGDVSVHLLDKELIFMDTSSDSTQGQSAAEPICWATLGMIQAALLWATNLEQNVDEISCRATGAIACRFRIRLVGKQVSSQ